MSAIARSVSILRGEGIPVAGTAATTGTLSGLQYPGVVRGALQLVTGHRSGALLAGCRWSGCICVGRQSPVFRRWAAIVPAGRLLVPADLSATVELAAGWYHNCALSAGGRVRCWGKRLQTCLNLGDCVGQSSPTDDLPPAEQISAGVYHSCALLRDARVRCWGDNRFGQLDVPPALARGQNSIAPSRIRRFSQLCAEPWWRYPVLGEQRVLIRPRCLRISARRCILRQVPSTAVRPNATGLVRCWGLE